MNKNAFCGYCGSLYGHDLWPRACPSCNQTTWRNPAPVVVVLVGLEHGGLLLVRRGIQPGKGGLALPGGYIDYGETWQEAAARELWEETTIKVSPSAFQLVDVRTATNGASLLVFAKTLDVEYPTNFAPNNEVQELVTITEPQNLVFSTHTEMAEGFLRRTL